jgi:hypothetical protein
MNFFINFSKNSKKMNIRKWIISDKLNDSIIKFSKKNNISPRELTKLLNVNGVSWSRNANMLKIDGIVYYKYVNFYRIMFDPPNDEYFERIYNAYNNLMIIESTL